MSLLLLLLPSFVASRAIFAIEMSRNGATAPGHFYDWDQDGRWDVGPGELTADGMRQQFLIGTQIRNKYIKEQSLMTTNVSTSQVYIVVTDTARMIMSAEAQSLGLYPPGFGPSLTRAQIPLAVPPMAVTNLEQLQNELGSAALPSYAAAMPIHGEITNSSTLLRPFDGGCPKVTALNSQLLNSSAVGQILAKYSETMSTLQSTLKLTSSEIQSQFFNIYSNLESNAFAGFPVPFSDETVANVTAMWQEVTNWVLSQNDEMNRLAGSAFLQELKWQFYGVMDNVCCYTRKFSLYISSGSSILMVLATLGKYNVTLPPLASVLLFELAESTPVTNPQYTVTVTLNDKALLIPTCPSVNCSFSTFMKYVTFRSFPDASVQCALSQPIPWDNLTDSTSGELPSDQITTRHHWTLWFAIAVISGVLLASAALVWLECRKARRLLRGAANSSHSDEFKLSFR